MALLLFDFDGVLADSLGDMIQFAQETCDELNVHHVVTADDLASLDTMSLAAYARQVEVPEPLVDEFVRRSLQRFMEKGSPPELFAGMQQVLKNLSSRHVLGIVSGNTQANVSQFLAGHGLDGCIRAIYGLDSPGSKAEKIARARSQFAAENEAVFMVGDSASDIRAAKAAGVRSIAVTWGHQSAETLLRAQPDFLVHSPQELLDVVLPQVLSIEKGMR